MATSHSELREITPVASPDEAAAIVAAVSAYLAGRTDEQEDAQSKTVGRWALSARIEHVSGRTVTLPATTHQSHPWVTAGRLLDG